MSGFRLEPLIEKFYTTFNLLQTLTIRRSIVNKQILQATSAIFLIVILILNIGSIASINLVQQRVYAQEDSPDTESTDGSTAISDTTSQIAGCHPSTEACSVSDLLLNDDDSVLCDPTQGTDCSPYLNPPAQEASDQGNTGAPPADEGNTGAPPADEGNTGAPPADEGNTGGPLPEFDWLTNGDDNMPVIQATDPAGQYCNPVAESCDSATASTYSPSGCMIDITTHGDVCDYSNAGGAQPGISTIQSFQASCNPDIETCQTMELTSGAGEGTTSLTESAGGEATNACTTEDQSAGGEDTNACTTEDQSAGGEDTNVCTTEDQSAGGEDTNACTTEDQSAGGEEQVTGSTSGPVIKMTSFKPEINGFHFPNGFTNKLVDFTIPVINKHVNFETEGRCGGMAFASLDYYFNHRAIPAFTTADFPAPDHVPPDGHPLSDYIWKRLIDSYKISALSNVRKFLSWTERPDATEKVSDSSIPTWLGGLTGVIVGHLTTIDGVTDLTRGEEIPKLQAIIDGDKPVPLGLVAASSISDIGHNHQVVAYGYKSDPSSGNIEVSIYDNNYPDKEAILSSSSSDPHVTESIAGRVVDTWRGFFVEDYDVAIPN